MATSLPYVNNPGTMLKVLAKIREAKAPERFTTDFLQTVIGLKGGNARQFIPLAKKLGLLKTDGTPTELYRKYRNPATSRIAMATALRTGYHDLFNQNEYAYKLSKDDLRGVVVEMTGMEPKNRVVQLIRQTFETLKQLADFEGSPAKEADNETAQAEPPLAEQEAPALQGLGLNLAYTINLVLPNSEDPAVFNAIFRALRDNLLRK